MRMGHVGLEEEGGVKGEVGEGGCMWPGGEPKRVERGGEECWLVGERRNFRKTALLGRGGISYEEQSTA